jgi:hypothetical protein
VTRKLLEVRYRIMPNGADYKTEIGRGELIRWVNDKLTGLNGMVKLRNLVK